MSFGVGQEEIELSSDGAAVAGASLAQAAETFEVVAAVDTRGEELLEDLGELPLSFGAERRERFGERGTACGVHPVEDRPAAVGQGEPQSSSAGRVAALDPARSDQVLDEAGSARLREPEGPAKLFDRSARRGADDHERRRGGAGVVDDLVRRGLLGVRELEGERSQQVRGAIAVCERSGSSMHYSCMLIGACAWCRTGDDAAPPGTA
jgi:hypothetical protein